MKRPPPSVFLVEASSGTRHLVARYLERTGTVRVVGTAADQRDAASRIVTTEPDVVIIDRLAAATDGRAFRAAVEGCGSRIVLHSATTPEESKSELVEAGVDDVVFKEVGMLDELIAAVHRVADSTRPRS